MEPIQTEVGAIMALQNGDIRGLEALVNLHQMRALRTAYAVTKDRALAEDCVADTFLTVYERIEQFDAQRAFAPWFNRILVNRALKARQRDRRTGHGDIEQDVLLRKIDTDPGPELETARAEARDAIFRAIMALPDRQRVAIVLRYYLDMNEFTMAEVLGCPVGTVKWRLHAAKKRLRRDTTFVHELALDLVDNKGEAR